MSQGYICFIFSEKVELRYKSSWKSQCIQKYNGFVNTGSVVFTNITEKAGSSNKLINTKISVMIHMVFTLPKTKSVYPFYLTSAIFKDSILTKKFLPLF